MTLGYDQKLYILAFDHRGSFQKKFFGIQGEPDAEQTAIIADAKHLIFEGMLQAVSAGADPSVTGVLVDEQFGSTVPEEAHAARSQARDAGGALRDRTCSTSSTARSSASTSNASTPTSRRCSSATTPMATPRKTPCSSASSSDLSDWLMEHDRKFLFELLVPAEPDQLASVGGDADRYDAELRPELMRRAIADIQDADIVVDIWKIEGVDERSDCEMLVKQARTGGREGVVCVVLGRGANDDKVDQWLQAAAPVDGFVGFAIGRSIWWDPLKAYVDGKIERSAGAKQISENFLRFVHVYERAEGKTPVAS